MCLIVAGWQVHPEFPLVVAANRDEFHARPTDGAAFWDDAPQIFGGRDRQAGGTWLAAHRDGRFAAVTNVREPGALGDGGQQQQWQQKPELVQQNGHQGGNVHVISPRSRHLSLAAGHSDWREPGVAPQIGAIRKMGCRSELL